MDLTGMLMRYQNIAFLLSDTAIKSIQIMKLTQKSSEMDTYLDFLKKALTGAIYDESAWTVIERGGYHERISFNRPVQYLYYYLRGFITSLLRRKGIILVRTKPFDKAVRDRGKDWPLVGYTMIGNRRLESLKRRSRSF
jgi:hypothetical protein